MKLGVLDQSQGTPPKGRTTRLRQLADRVPSGVLQNFCALYGLYCSTYLLALITVPYLGHVLGPASWGTVAAVQSYGGYLLLTVEFGFGFSATREAARSRGDRERLRGILANVQAAKLVLAAVCVALSYAAWRALPLFREHSRLFWWGVVWAVVQGSNLGWFFQSLERMRLMVIADLSLKALAVVAIFAWVHGPADAARVLEFQALASISSWLLISSLAWREVGFQAPAPRLVWSALRRSMPTFVPRNASVLYTVGNTFLLSLFAPPAAVGYYAGADRICRAVVGLLNPASEAVYPRISHLAHNSPGQARKWVRPAAALFGGISICMGTCLFLFAPLLVRVLLGPGFAPAVPLLRILAILPPAVALRNILGIHWMLPLGLERPLNAIVISAGVFNVGMALWVAPLYGGFGMAWVVVASQIIAGLAAYLFLRWKRLDPLTRREHAAPADPAVQCVADAVE
jgi:PST family polysaccharide transporter